MLNLQTITNINQLLKKDIDIISEKYLLNNKSEYSAFYFVYSYVRFSVARFKKYFSNFYICSFFDLLLVALHCLSIFKIYAL